MADKRAREFFSGSYNCAQSVLKTFQDKKGVSEEVVNEFRAYGGGRADGGVCGALHAARYLAGEEHSDSVDEEFVSESESPLCREIRKKRKLSCADCVALAARVMQKRIEG